MIFQNFVEQYYNFLAFYNTYVSTDVQTVNIFTYIILENFEDLAFSVQYELLRIACLKKVHSSIICCSSYNYLKKENLIEFYSGGGFLGYLIYFH